MEEMELEEELEEEVKMKRRNSEHCQSVEEQGKKKGPREQQDERGEGRRKRDFSDNFRTSFTDYPKERRKGGWRKVTVEREKGDRKKKGEKRSLKNE